MDGRFSGQAERYREKQQKALVSGRWVLVPLNLHGTKKESKVTGSLLQYQSDNCPTPDTWVREGNGTTQWAWGVANRSLFQSSGAQCRHLSRMMVIIEFKKISAQKEGSHGVLLADRSSQKKKNKQLRMHCELHKGQD